MIRRVAGSLSATAAVFLREMVRSARQWRTYGLRVGFGIGLFGMVLAFWQSSMGRWTDVARAAEIGRSLFVAYAAAQITLVVVLAPSLVAQGIIEEKEDETLDLLAITRMSARQIVAGKVASRLWALVMLVLGGTPVLALVVTFGGVAPWQFVNVVANTLLAVVLLGSLGGLFALVARSTLLPLVATAAWMVPALAIVPTLYVGLADGGEREFAHLLPPVAMLADGPEGLLPLLAFLPVVFLAWRWSGPLFALTALAGDDPDGSLLSLDFWRFEVLRRRLGLVGAAAVLVLPLVIGATLYLHRSGSLAPGLEQVLRAGLWSWAVLLLFAGSGLYVLAVVEGRALVGRLRDRHRQQREAAAQVAREGERARPVRSRVWGNPVAWREIVTGAWGSTWLARWGLVIWLGVASLVAMVAGPLETAAVFVVTGSLCSLGVTATLATESLVSERRSGTLELLLNTTMGSARVVGGKLASLAVWTVPYLVIGWGVLVMHRLQSGHAFGGLHEPWCEESTLLLGRAALGVPLTAVWLLGTWAAMALACLLAARLVRPPRLVWAVNSLIVVAVAVVPFLVEEWLGWRQLRILLLPVTDDGWLHPACGISPHLVVASVGAPLVAAGLFVVAAWRLRRPARG